MSLLLFKINLLFSSVVMAAPLILRPLAAANEMQRCAVTVASAVVISFDFLKYNELV